MEVAFDPDKDAENQAKHGLSLAFGADVLNDPNLLEILDVRYDYPEDRFVAYGMVSAQVWVCVYTLRGTIARIISVRKATRHETRRYYEIPR